MHDSGAGALNSINRSLKHSSKLVQCGIYMSSQENTVLCKHYKQVLSLQVGLYMHSRVRRASVNLHGNSVYH